MKNYSLLTSAASILLAFTLTFIGGELKAQQGLDEVLSNGEIRGNFQLEAQYYQEDSLIGAQDVPEKILSNGFLNLIYTNGSFSMGVR